MADPTIILDFFMDWSVEPEMSYSFSTVVQDTALFNEQRRSMLQTVTRELSYNFVEQRQDYQRVLQQLQAAKGVPLCVPIYFEPIAADDIVTGGSSITALTDLSVLWNTNHCSYIVLLNLATKVSEVKGVIEIVGQMIKFATNIIGVWDASQTVVYPAIVASLDYVKASNKTSQVAVIEASFSEIGLGAEATEEWVGLETAICCGGDPRPVISEVTFSIASEADDNWRWGIGGTNLRHDGAAFGRFFESWSYTDRSCFRYINVNIPRGVRIRQAYITMRQVSGDTSWSVFDIKINNVANAIAPTSVATFDSLVWAESPVVVWDHPTQMSSPQVTPDLSPLIQYVIDLPDWVPGNAIQIGFFPNASHGYSPIGFAGLWVGTSDTGDRNILTVG